MNMRDCRINVPPRRAGQWTSGAMQSGQAGQTGAMQGAPMGQSGMMPGVPMGQSGAMQCAPMGQMMPMQGRPMGGAAQMGQMPERSMDGAARMGQMPERSMGNMAQMGSQEELMRMINEASFAMDEVLLFLDTHPEDAAAMQYYQNVAAMRRNAMNAYQNQFGPLMVDDVRGNRWDWVTEKWPWEGGC